jgi:outer membrane protein TolC
MRVSALLLTVAAATVLAAPAHARDRVNLPLKEPAEESAKKIKELQKERIATLKELVDVLTKLAQNGRVEIGEALEARLLLLNAELGAAEKGADCIALYKKAIDALKEYEELADARVKAGRGTVATGLNIKARRLEVEIQLEKAKAKEAKENK